MPVAVDRKRAPASGPVVVTGFEPFGGRSRNRSWEAVRRLSGALPCETRQLPVNYARLRDDIAMICDRQPSVVLLVGECPARSLAVEQIALNVVDTERPDNSRRRPAQETLLAGAPLALRSTWDARAVAARIQAAGIPATSSFHAGTYACNAALFLALASLGENARVGFLHVPYWPRPRGIRLDALGQAIRICVEALSVSRPSRRLRGAQDV